MKQNRWICAFCLQGGKLSFSFIVNTVLIYRVRVMVTVRVSVTVLASGLGLALALGLVLVLTFVLHDKTPL